jgi:superfamily II DNA or RNA helicase
MKIHILDPVWTECDEEAADFLRNEFSYKVIRWEKSFGQTNRMVDKEYLIQGWNDDQFMFLTGFVPRAIKYFNKWDEPYDYISDIEPVDYSDPFINGEEFRPYQKDLIDKGLSYGYGTIVAPTGSGKSFIIYGLISAFPSSNILLLVHTLDLVQQLKQGLIDIGYDPGEFTGSKKEFKRITVATVQSYSKVAHQYVDSWDVVMVDEGHHVSSPETGVYFNALAYCGASVRYAFTATTADKEAQRVGLEGLIGPIIGELTMAEGQELGFLAEPEIIFVESPLPRSIFEYIKTPGYTTIYKDGIVDNFNRTVRIIHEIEQEVGKGGIVLVLVKQIRHMNNIMEYIEIPVDIVKGSVKKEDRLEIKENLKSGKSQCVIATTAWVEGIDIPNLTMVINGGGGLSEKETLQKIGRGLRKTKNKNTVKIIDFMDVRTTGRNPFTRQRSGEGKKHMLHKQSIKRWEIYKEQGWEPKLK